MSNGDFPGVQIERPSSTPPPPKIPLGKKDQAKINLSHAKISLAAEAMEGLPMGASLPNTKREQAALSHFSSELTDLRDAMPKLMSRASAAQAVAVKAQDMAATAKAEVAAAKAEAAAATEATAAAKAEVAAAAEEAAAAKAEAAAAKEEAAAAASEAAAAREEAAAAKQQATAVAGAMEQQKEQADAEAASMRSALDKVSKKQEEIIAKLTARMDEVEQKLTVPMLPSGRATPALSEPKRKVSATATVPAEPEGPSEEEPNLIDKFFSIFNKPKEDEAAPAEVIEPACYLLFSSASGGTFLVHWSEVPVPGALACFVPEKPVPKFKYESNGGRSELKRSVGGPNKKLFYAGWVSFVRMAFSHSGIFTFLGNVHASPIGVYVNMKADMSVVRLEVGDPLKLTNAIAAVAIAPGLATNLDVQKMNTRMFTSVGEKQGAAFSLDGGQDGFDEKVSTPRRSSVDE